jgi:hypothetical protein
MIRPSVSTAVGLACLCAAACSDPYAGRYAVSGTVTLAGQPLDAGAVVFEPLDGQGTQATAPVAAGSYRIPREQGLKAGRYRVRLSAPDGKTTVNEEEAGGPGGTANVTFADLIPPDWSTQSKHEVTVEAGGTNEFPFAVPNRATPGKRKQR